MANIKIMTLALTFALGACVDYPEIAVQRSGNDLILEGVIDGETLGILHAARQSNPGIEKLVLLNIPGSADDESSLRRLSQYIRSNGLDTVVPANGLVASGGTDMIVMGRTRVIEPGACIGVHTWAAGGLLGIELGADLAKTDPTHDLYLGFYREMGISTDFYWFTLAAAGPDEVHWMSEDEINRFGLSTSPLKGSPIETAQERAERCYSRLN